MKKIIFLLCCFSFGITQAQVKVDPMKPKTTVAPITRTTGQQQTITPLSVSTLTRNIENKIPKMNDLQLSDFQIQKDLVSGLYTLSCKVTNVGVNDVLLDPLGYIKCNNENYKTDMVGLLVHVKIEPENCSLSQCGFVPGFSLWINKPDGTVIDHTTPVTASVRTLKAGQSLVAKTFRPITIFWNKPSPCTTSQRIEISLVLDPINALGDQNLANNTLKAYFPIQN